MELVARNPLKGHLYDAHGRDQRRALAGHQKKIPRCVSIENLRTRPMDYSSMVGIGLGLLGEAVGLL